MAYFFLTYFSLRRNEGEISMFFPQAVSISTTLDVQIDAVRVTPKPRTQMDPECVGDVRPHVTACMLPLYACTPDMFWSPPQYGGFLLFQPLLAGHSFATHFYHRLRGVSVPLPCATSCVSGLLERDMLMTCISSSACSAVVIVACVVPISDPEELPEL